MRFYPPTKPHGLLARNRFSDNPNNIGRVPRSCYTGVPAVARWGGCKRYALVWKAVPRLYGLTRDLKYRINMLKDGN